MSSRPIRLDKALRNGRVRYVIVPIDERIRPASGHAWLVLGGLFGHITGTDSYLSANAWSQIGALQNAFFATRIEAATASGTYPVFGLEAGELFSQFQIVILTDMDCFYLSGGAGARACLRVLEWEL